MLLLLLSVASIMMFYNNPLLNPIAEIVADVFLPWETHTVPANIKLPLHSRTANSP
jgi:hypothetical protein